MTERISRANTLFYKIPQLISRREIRDAAIMKRSLMSLDAISRHDIGFFLFAQLSETNYRRYHVLRANRGFGESFVRVS